MQKLKPILNSNWWLIGPPPDNLDSLLPGPDPEEASGLGADDPSAKKEHNAPVDHHIFQSDDGTWHLWGCIRATKVGRILYHWETDDFRKSPWGATGEFIRKDENCGESIRDWNDEEWLQSPYFIHVDGLRYMFYGGHATGGNISDGKIYEDKSLPCQMCLMTSKDGLHWERHKDKDGLSRIFAGPGEVRDPCLLNIDGIWHCYYAGFNKGDSWNHGFYCRTSKDLINWSDYTVIHKDHNICPERWSTECPHVIYNEGYYYLFRTENYYESKTHVFRSKNPMDFGVGDASDKYIGVFPAAAVEIYKINNMFYVSSNHNPPLGTQMAEIKWVKDQ